MVMDADWDTTMPTCTYHILAGCSLWQALLDLSSQDKYSRLKKVLVQVYAGVSQAQALKISASFQQQHALMMDETPTMEAKVGICRTLLYSLHDLDEDVDEPPTCVKDEWRQVAAAALGRVGTSPKERKPLEQIFQLAQTSRRCYAKVKRICRIHEETTGKPLAITIFREMQGLKEADRFDVLCSVVNGDIKADMPSVGVEARRRKNLMSVRREFQLVAKKRTWEECVEAFPMHTTVDALQPFMDMDMKKAVPRKFLDFVSEAETYKDRNCDLTEDGNQASLLVLEAEVIGQQTIPIVCKEASRVGRVAVIVEGIKSAVHWMDELERNHLVLMAESTVTYGDCAKHLLVARNAETNAVETHQKLMTREEVWKYLLETYTREGDIVFHDVVKQEEFTCIADMNRRETKELRCTIPDTSGSEFDFTDVE